LGAVDIHIDD